MASSHTVYDRVQHQPRHVLYTNDAVTESWTEHQCLGFQPHLSDFVFGADPIKRKPLEFDGKVFWTHTGHSSSSLPNRMDGTTERVGCSWPQA